MGEKLRQKQAISSVKGQADGKITFAVYDCVIHADIRVHVQVLQSPNK